MSFLAPLYALAALAVTLPIAFHLLQRTPRGRQVFGSLMFLKPTPPKITRRSRLSDLLLLLLRAAALILMALAFCRPFLRTLEQFSGELSNRQIAILVDTRASSSSTNISLSGETSVGRDSVAGSGTSALISGSAGASGSGGVDSCSADQATG